MILGLFVTVVNVIITGLNSSTRSTLTDCRWQVIITNNHYLCVEESMNIENTFIMVNFKKIVKKHLCLLFDRHNLFPISFGNMFLNDFVIGEEKIIKSFITIGNVPSQNSARFDHSHKLLEGLRYNRSGKHSSWAKHYIVCSVFNWSFFIRSYIATNSFPGINIIFWIFPEKFFSLILRKSFTLKIVNK